MKSLHIALCLLCGTLCGACARYTGIPKPLLVVVSYEGACGTPDYAGAGSPIFALYDDGSIICYHQPARGEYPAAEKLFTIRKVKDPEKKAAELLSFDLKKVENDYSLSRATDQGLTVIWTPTKKIEIYGNWKTPRKFDPAMEKDPEYQEIIKFENALWKTLPDEIRQFLLRIEKENAVAGSPWLPEKIDPATGRFPFPYEELWQPKPLESFQESSQ